MPDTRARRAHTHSNPHRKGPLSSGIMSAHLAASQVLTSTASHDAGARTVETSVLPSDGSEQVPAMPPAGALASIFLTIEMCRRQLPIRISRSELRRRVRLSGCYYVHRNQLFLSEADFACVLEGLRPAVLRGRLLCLTRQWFSVCGRAASLLLLSKCGIPAPSWCAGNGVRAPPRQPAGEGESLWGAVRRLSQRLA